MYAQAGCQQHLFLHPHPIHNSKYLDIVNLLKAFPLGAFPPDPRADQNGPGSDVTMAQPGSSLTTSAHKNF